MTQGLNLIEKQKQKQLPKRKTKMLHTKIYACRCKDATSIMNSLNMSSTHVLSTKVEYIQSQYQLKLSKI